MSCMRYETNTYSEISAGAGKMNVTCFWYAKVSNCEKNCRRKTLVKHTKKVLWRHMRGNARPRASAHMNTLIQTYLLQHLLTCHAMPYHADDTHRDNCGKRNLNEQSFRCHLYIYSILYIILASPIIFHVHLLFNTFCSSASLCQCWYGGWLVGWLAWVEIIHI